MTDTGGAAELAAARYDLKVLEERIDRAEMWSDPTPLYRMRHALEDKIAALAARTSGTGVGE